MNYSDYNTLRRETIARILKQCFSSQNTTLNSNSVIPKEAMLYELSSDREQEESIHYNSAQRSLHNEKRGQIKQQVFHRLNICLQTRKGTPKTMFNTIWGSFHTLLPSIITEA